MADTRQRLFYYLDTTDREPTQGYVSGRGVFNFSGITTETNANGDPLLGKNQILAGTYFRGDVRGVPGQVSRPGNRERGVNPLVLGCW